MGNTIPAQQIATANLTKPTLGVFEFRAVTTGTIRAAYLWGGAGPGTSFWNLFKNGVKQWSGATRLQYGGGSGSKTGLSISVTSGDTIRLDLEQHGGGTIGGPFYFILTTEEP